GRIDYHSSIHECALNLRSRAVELFATMNDWMNNDELAAKYEQNCIEILPRFIASVLKIAKTMSNTSPPPAKGKTKEQQASTAASKAFLTKFDGGAHLGKTGSNLSTWTCACEGCNEKIAQFIVSGFCEKKKIQDTSTEPEFHALLCLEHHKQWEKGTEIKIGNGKTKFAKGKSGGGDNKSNTPNPNLTDKQRERRRNQRRAYRARKKAKKQNAGSGSTSGQSSAQSSSTANTSENSEKSETKSEQPQQSDSGKVQVSSDGTVSMTAQQLATLMSLSTVSANGTASESKPTDNNSVVSANATTKEPDIYQQLINVVSAAKTTASNVAP
ncbi:MAG: hypothetical protein CMM07_07320, partial [Rhodopirellula sp.]|nr:hypothetical protein [Rhodopirellula sp.]